MALKDHFTVWDWHGYPNGFVPSEPLEVEYDSSPYVGVKAPVCTTCGAYVHDPAKHAEFHDALIKSVTTAVAAAHRSLEWGE